VSKANQQAIIGRKGFLSYMPEHAMFNEHELEAINDDD